MLLPASVDDSVVTRHSAEHFCGASALRNATRLIRPYPSSFEISSLATQSSGRVKAPPISILAILGLWP